MNTKVLFIWTLSIFFSMHSFAQNKISKLIENSKEAFVQENIIVPFTTSIEKKHDRDINTALDNYSLLELDTKFSKQALRTQSNTLYLELPIVNDELSKVRLSKAKITTDDFQIKDAKNNTHSINSGSAAFYWGTVDDNPNSLVAFSIYENTVSGMIHLEGESYTLTKLKSQKQHIIYKNSDRKAVVPFACDTEDQLSTAIPDLEIESREDSDNCVRIYIEADFDFYEAYDNSITATTEHIMNVFNQSAILYANEGIETVISEIKIWTTEDPYTGIGTAALLQEFGDEMADGFNGDLAHLYGDRLNAGRAWVNVLCHSLNKYRTAYMDVTADFDLVPAYSNSVMVVTHETGHNLGSVHTHACAWNGNETVIDGCGQVAGYPEGDCDTGTVPAKGTIMSYCHLVSGVGIDFSLGFGLQPGNFIRDKVSNGSCLSSCEEESVDLGCNVIDGFENGNPWGNWIDGGADCNRINNSSHANTGSYSIELKDNNAGSHVTTTVFDATDYSAITVSFSYKVVSFDSPTEDFWLQISTDGGDTFTFVEEWNQGDEFLNGQRKFDAVSIAGPFTENTALRFKCDADGPWDFVYLDDIEIDFLCDEFECGFSEADDFEIDNPWGNWIDGGADCNRINNPIHANTGSYSIELKDNNAGSHVTTTVFDATDYSAITVSFSYKVVSFDSPTEDFWLQISTDGGDTFTFVEEWNQGDEFLNGQRKFDAVSIAGPFTENTALRFKCDADGPWDFVYLDDIEIDFLCDEFECGFSETDDFENGNPWGNWIDGGADCNRINNSSHANTGSYSIELKDNNAGSHVTTTVFDATDYSAITVSFSYKVVSFDSPTEDFWLQISTDGGDTFTFVEEWNQGDEFLNGQRKFDAVSIAGPFTENTALRFKCDADGPWDFVYLDDIEIDFLCDEFECDFSEADDFEIDNPWGNWIDGGADCGRIYNSNHANSGNYSIMLKDDTPSSFTRTAAFDASGYSEINVNFSYKVVSFDGPTEDFWLQISLDGGVTYSIVEEWNQGDEFENTERKFDAVSIAGPFSNNTVIRFKSDANGPYDWVYLDDIEIDFICGGENCDVIDEEGFEVNMGIWNDGGIDCKRYITPYANTGSYALELRDNTSMSKMTTDVLNLTSFSEVTIDFYYYVSNFTSVLHKFELSKSVNGENFELIQDWNWGDDFVNDVLEFESVLIPGPFANNTVFKFTCIADNNDNKIYFDDVIINGCDASGNIQFIDTDQDVEESEILIYPNPGIVNGSLKIEKPQNLLINSFSIFNTAGQELLTSKWDENNTLVEVPLDNFESASYFIKFETATSIVVEKFIIIK